MNNGQKIAAVVLAAGKGVRMKCQNVNKVMMPILGRPMIAYTCDLLKKIKVGKVILVVGFAQDSIKKFLGPRYLYVEQKKQLGTAHAVTCALKIIPRRFQEILVVNGDDSGFYPPEVILNLVKRHYQKRADLTLLTIEMKNPKGLGRILRDKKGEIVAIIEEKDASNSQKKIKEINPGCYLFQRPFLEKYLPGVPKSPVSGEYYLTDLVGLGVKNKGNVESLKLKVIAWRGVNTLTEFQEAEKIMEGLKNGN